MNIRSRFNKILELMHAQDIDGLLLNAGPNVSYAVGFHAPDSYLLASAQGITLVTDFRYKADFQRKAQAPVKIKEHKQNIFNSIVKTIKDQRLKKIGFESRHLTFAECELLNKLTKKQFLFVPLTETIEPLREIKEEEEIKNIKKALAITQEAYAFIKKKLKPGKSELGIAAEIEYFIRQNGARSSAFDIIVASGPNSSYPHAQVTDRRLCLNEPILIDMGIEYNGYKCDLTRTFFLGRIKPIVRKAHEAILSAQQKAIAAIKPGVLAKDIDSVARNCITEKGFGKFFGHALGHGVGLEVHECPSIDRKNSKPLKTGMVFTIEPGIYLAGRFGIRREDMVLVTDNASMVLSWER
jgi:Xaa-Pro aminopeptidase